MKLRIFVLALALGLVGTTGAVYGAEPTDFDFEVVPAASTLWAPAGGSVDLNVILKTRIDKTQGWSYGLVFQKDAGVTAEITELKGGTIINTLYNGNPAEFKSLSWYRADDSLGADCYLLSPPGVCTDIEAASFTEGIVIHMMQLVTMPPKPDGIITAELKVQAAGPDGAKAQLVFVNTAGEPDIETVIVHGGLSIAPAIKNGATIDFVTPACVVPTAFTIEVEGGEGVENAEVHSMVTLNFNADDSGPDKKIQGWSYGIGVDDPSLLEPLSGTIDGTDTATAKNGSPPDFNVVAIYANGVTHAVNIHVMAQITIDAQNDWTDLDVVYKTKMTAEGQSTYVVSRNLAIGEPVVENGMVVGGFFFGASKFEGRDPSDPATGCCDPAICNIPGIFTFQTGPKPVKFLPGSANNDDRIDLADGIYLLSYLFRQGPPPPCLQAADFNGDNAVDSSDAIAVIFWHLQPDPDDWPMYPPPPSEPPLGTACVEEIPELGCEVPTAICK